MSESGIEEWLQDNRFDVGRDGIRRKKEKRITRRRRGRGDSQRVGWLSGASGAMVGMWS